MLFSELENIRKDPNAQTVNWRFLRQKAKQESDKQREGLLANASKAGISPVRYIKEWLTESTPNQYQERIGLLLAWNRQGRPVQPIREFREVVTYAETVRKPFLGDLGLWLLGVQEAPDPYDFKLPYWRNLSFVAKLDYEHRKARKGKGRGNQADTVRFLNQHCEALRDNTEKDLRQSIVRRLVGYNLVPLGLLQFNNLHARLRRLILAKRSRRFSLSSVLLTPQFLAQIEDDPLRFPETEEAIAERKWETVTVRYALQAIQQRRFQDRHFIQLFRHSRLVEYEDRIREAFQCITELPQDRWDGNGVTFRFQPFQPVRSIPKTLSPDLRQAFLFFRDVPHRKDAFTSLRKEGQELWERTANLLAQHEWEAALRACRSRETLQRGFAILRRSPSDERAEQWTNMLTHECTWQATCAILDAILEEQWPAEEWERWRRFWSPERLPLHSRSARLLEDTSFLSFLGQETASKTFLTRFFPTLPLSLRRGLLDSPSEKVQLFRETWRSHAEEETYEGLSKYLRFILSGQLSRLSSKTLPRVSHDEYYKILSTFQSTEFREIFRHIFALRLTTGELGWEVLVKKRYPRRLLHKLAARHDKRRLRALERHTKPQRRIPSNPQAAIQAVLDAEAHPGSAPYLQNRLREFIPWARQHYADRPTRAVAAELALATTLWEARYLLYLCTYRWKANPHRKEGRVFDEFYSTYPLPKRSGGSRTITAPDPALKRLQRAILHFILEPERVHPAAHGFVKERSTRTNAEIHCGRKLVVNCDIRSFFPSTPHRLIRQTFACLEHLQLTPGAVSVLSDLCSYQGGLPTGAPTSPALANLILRPIDEALTKAAEAQGFAYSRYADDLNFSGDGDVASILPFVRRVLGDFGYELDPKKTNIFRRGRRQIATGLVVNDKPNLPRRQRRRLRAAAHCRRHGRPVHWHGRPMSDEELQGRLAYLHVVQPEEARRYLQLWHSKDLAERGS